MEEKKLTYEQKVYRKRKALGVCPVCGKDKGREGFYCITCLERTNKSNRETRAFFRNLGICPVCRKEKLFGDEKQCIVCLQKQRDYRQKNSKTLQQKRDKAFGEKVKMRYQKRIEEGICTRCAKRKAATGRTKCRICLDKDAEIHRLRREKREKSVAEFRIENKLCFYCEKPVDTTTKLCSVCLEKCRNRGRKGKEANKYWQASNELIFNK